MRLVLCSAFVINIPLSGAVSEVSVVRNADYDGARFLFDPQIMRPPAVGRAKASRVGWCAVLSACDMRKLPRVIWARFSY